MQSQVDMGADHNTGKIAYLGLMTALAALMGYVELLLPTGLGIPGFKLGLCNIVIVFALYFFGTAEAALISTARVLIIGFMFGNLSGILYSLFGSACALAVMALLKKTGIFSPAGVSAAGGSAHNAGQLVCAYLLLPGIPFEGYLPVLLTAGCLAGLLNGIITIAILKRVRPYAYAK